MFAVIFRAELATLDPDYADMAARMRTLAVEKYGCRGISVATEGNQEIAISYWDSEAQIQAWKHDPEHQAAKKLGQSKWYRTYTVQIVEVLREYEMPG